MLGCWPEADTARTGSAAAGYLVYAVAIAAHCTQLYGPAAVSSAVTISSTCAD